MRYKSRLKYNKLNNYNNRNKESNNNKLNNKLLRRLVQLRLQKILLIIVSKE
jgi:hypothetical protein